MWNVLKLHTMSRVVMLNVLKCTILPSFYTLTPKLDTVGRVTFFHLLRGVYGTIFLKVQLVFWMFGQILN